MIRMLVVISVAFLFLAGCGKENMPKEMPEDFNFSVSFGYGEINKNEINTYNGNVTKDLIVKGTASAEMTFSEDEMQAIYAKMKDVNVMGEKQVPGPGGCNQTPSNTDSWEVTVNGETKTFSWTSAYCDLTKDAEQLKEPRTYIQQLVEGKEAYKALPAAEGGYD